MKLNSKDKLKRGIQVADDQLGRLLEAAPDAMVAVDHSGVIVMTNTQAEALFGYCREELLAQKIEMLMPARYRGVHPQHRNDFFSKPRVRPMGPDLELFGLHKDGREFPLEIALSPLQTSGGGLVVTAIRDVSERKRTEESLRMLTSHSKIATSLEIPEDFGRLPQDVETTIFRVVQECLTNIHRHSGSTVANIRIFRNAGEVLVEVRDQGKRITPEKQKVMKTGDGLGVGIRGMRERLRQLGGSLQLNSDQEGTVVIARLPMESASSTTAA